MKKIAIINGPNLNLLGQREPGIYGNKGFEDFLQELKTTFPNVELKSWQSNIGGELVDALQKFGSDEGMVLNRAA